VDDIIDDAKSVSVVSEIPTVTTVDELTLAQALAELKSAKLLTQGISFREPSVATTTITAAPEPTQDKGKAQEQEELSNAEKATLFVQLFEKKRKHFAAKRAEEKRNKPPTQAQQIKIMCTYLKNMEGKKPKDLKNKYFDSIQKMFDRAFKRVNTFVNFRTYLMEGSSKRVGDELEQENAKKQKVDDDKETTDLKSLMVVMPDEEENALDAIPFAVKSPSIVDWKIHKEGKKSYYQIIRADGSSKMYLVFSHMRKSFDREDLETLYKLVKAKYRSTRPVEDLDLVLYGDLKTMFEPHVEDNVWKNQSDYKGMIVGIKSLLEVTAAKVCVTAAKQKIACVTVNGKRAYELKGKFLDDLRDYAFSGTNGEDVVEHIEYFLKIVDPINLINANHERLRLSTFPISLIGSASKWFDEIKAIRDPTNTTFEEWLASKFANHGMMDPFTKKVKVNNDEEHETDEEGYELFNDTTHNSRKMKSSSIRHIQDLAGKEIDKSWKNEELWKKLSGVVMIVKMVKVMHRA
ncbi:hypothetical protein Tco_0434367, partial [Tanacetum coccineum]